MGVALLGDGQGRDPPVAPITRLHLSCAVLAAFALPWVADPGVPKTCRDCSSGKSATCIAKLVIAMMDAALSDQR